MSTLRSFISATVRGLLIGAAFIAPISSFGVEQFKESSSGTSFDKSTAFTHNGKTFKLDATGAALRRKWFVKGYVIGHYIENPVIGTQEEVLEDIFSNAKAKQITKIWLHQLPLSLIRESYKETLQKVMTASEYEKNQADINRFAKFFKEDAEVGDVHYLRWLPGGYVELYKNEEQRGSLVNAELAKALWSMWLGPESVVDRKKLIALTSTD